MPGAAYYQSILYCFVHLVLPTTARDLLPAPEHDADEQQGEHQQQRAADDDAS